MALWRRHPRFRYRGIRYPGKRLAMGRTAARRSSAGGKSGLLRTGWSVTPTGRKARESATERYRRVRFLRRAGAVRVKWCGKSAPAAGRLAGSANPTRSKAKQRETAAQAAGGSVRSARPSGRLLEAASNRRSREMAVTAAGASRRAGQNPAYSPVARHFSCGRAGEALSAPRRDLETSSWPRPIRPAPVRCRSPAAAWRCKAGSCWCGDRAPRPSAIRAGSRAGEP